MKNKYTLPQRYTYHATGLGGGMGDILTCNDSHLDRNVIIKILKNGEEERRLLDEQKALLKLRSKHVVQLYDLIDIRHDDKIKKGLVLEYINGVDLEYQDGEPVFHKLKKLWQIACGLSDIHSAGIIHRDIKLNNIRLDENNIIKILDFGLARSSGTEAFTHSVIGTLGYMAPELWRHKDISFDHKIDVYAYGVVVLDILGIEKPQELYMQPPQKITTVPELNALVPNDLANIFCECLSYNKDARPTMDTIKELIARHLLKDRHRALFVLNGKKYLLNHKKRDVSITWGGGGSMKIIYDGYDFKVSAYTGNCTINNKKVAINQIFPTCSVITLINGGIRTFVTFDISRPEVIS